jgi:hypothetical protein
VLGEGGLPLPLPLHEKGSPSDIGNNMDYFLNMNPHGDLKQIMKLFFEYEPEWRIVKSMG